MIAAYRWSVVLRTAVFLGLFACLQLVWEALHGGPIEHAVIHDMTVRPAAFLINLITPAAQAHAVEFSLLALGGGLHILNGCEGMDAVFLLSTAFAVAPMTLGKRAVDLLLCIVFIFLVNQARILLFYAYRHDRSSFDLLHATVTPIVVVLLVSAYLYAWLFISDRHHDEPA